LFPGLRGRRFFRRLAGFHGGGRLLGASELQEDFLEADGGGAHFVEIPAGIDDGASEIAADGAVVVGLDFKSESAGGGVAREDASDAGNQFEAGLGGDGIKSAIAGGDFDKDGAGTASAILQIVDGVGGDELALINDDDLFAGLLDFGKDVGAENDGVIAGEGLDEVAGFVNLFGIEASGRLVKNQDVGIVNDGLG